MVDFIFISGAPGSGKTTISNILSGKLKNPPLIDFGRIREFHLNRSWSNASKKEEEMSFENLVFILKNYAKRKYKKIIINDLQDFRIEQIPKIFRKYNYVIFSLIVEDKDELKKRVLEERDSGFKNVKKALDWNKKLIERKTLKNEFKINNSSKDPGSAIREILKILN